ncbi:MAG: IS200/IS605 family transposase [bacterium]
MANPYHQISMQLIIAVKYREAMIKDSFREDLHKYITGILQKQKHKMLAINSMPDHMHIFFGMHPCDIPALVRDIKSDSSTFINAKKLSNHRFHWQEGYGLFSYSMSHRSSVIKYIENQQEHHKKITFKEEYLYHLKKFEVDYDLKYLFEFFE